MSTVTHGVGHWAMIPVALACVLALYLTLGVDIANISISIVTMLLLPILQHSQNRDGAAIQAKLDELIRVTDARNDLIGVDRRTEKEIEELRT